MESNKSKVKIRKRVSFSLSIHCFPLCLFKICHSYMACFFTFIEQLDLVVSYDGGSDL